MEAQNGGPEWRPARSVGGRNPSCVESRGLLGPSSPLRSVAAVRGGHKPPDTGTAVCGPTALPRVPRNSAEDEAVDVDFFS